MIIDKFEVGQVWENDYFITIKVWGNYSSMAYGVRLNKRNGHIESTETLNLFDTKKYDTYKGMAKYHVDAWYEVN